MESLNPDVAQDLIDGAPGLDKPALTPADVKPTTAKVSERIANILRDAEARARAKGNGDNVRASFADERIIGRGGNLKDLSYLEVGIAVARGVARIRVSGGGFGTGSLIGPRVLMTNNHVIASPAEADGSRAEFDVQDDVHGRPLPRHLYALDPKYFFFTSPDLDVTLIGIAERSESGRPASDYPWTKISTADGDLVDRDAITIIQHPLGGLKQIAFRNNDVVLVKDLPSFLHYTTDTQPGSSGSPCFDDLWRLVALHHQGVPATNADGEILKTDKKPYRKGVDRADSILWIANEGARMSAVGPALRDAKLPTAAMEALRAKFLDELAPPNPVALARESIPQQRPNLKSMERPMGTNGGISIVVNVLNDEIRGVHIERGGSDGVTVASTPSPSQDASPQPVDATGADLASDEAITIDPDYKNRKGYDPDFLGVPIPLPTLDDEQRKLSARVPDSFLGKNDDPLVFKYHHYSLAFNSKRHIAWYSAANVDGDQRKHKYEREKDKWFFDPRMDDLDNPKHQLGEPLYAAKNTDRGHLTRYLDVQWGATMKETRNATNDSFHFSNCALQVSGFNQGKDRWQGIERFLLEEKARKEKRRMVVMTGPILRKNDPRYRSEDMEKRGIDPVRVPLAFWKLAAIVPNDDRPLAVTAFVLGQPDAADLDDVLEKFDVTAVQITVAKLAKLTGFTFAKILTDNDHFAKVGPGTLEAVGITRDHDIVV